MHLPQISTMPQVGFGLWKVAPNDCASVVHNAIKAGYRHFDSACDYGNETEVGEGLKSVLDAGDVKREDLWITSKLWNTYHAPEHVRPALERPLEDFQLDYLDLYLIHFPIALKYVDFETRYPPEWIFDPNADEPRMERAPVPLHQTWAAMEQLVKDGLVKHIGVCNYNTGLIHDLMSYAEIKPYVLQVELHPYNTQDKLLQTCADYEIAVTGFSPLGALSYFELDMAGQDESVIQQAVVKDIAQNHGKTAAQIVLRWGVQRGTSIIPKTTKPERMVENLSIFDFTLSDDEMAAISKLDLGKRFNDPGEFCAAAFNTFHSIYD